MRECRPVALLVLLFTLAACGQKGPLVLPSEQPPLTNATSNPQTQASAASSTQRQDESQEEQ